MKHGWQGPRNRLGSMKHARFFLSAGLEPGAAPVPCFIRVSSVAKKSDSGGERGRDAPATDRALPQNSCPCSRPRLTFLNMQSRHNVCGKPMCQRLVVFFATLAVLLPQTFAAAQRAPGAAAGKPATPAESLTVPDGFKVELIHSALPGAGELRYGAPAPLGSGEAVIKGSRKDGMVRCLTLHCAELWQLMHDEFLALWLNWRWPFCTKEMSFIAPSLGPDKRSPQPKVAPP